MDKPTLNRTERSVKEDSLLQIVQKSSRDHASTMADDDMSVTIAKAWPAIEQALAQFQRDMARPGTEKDTNLNAVFGAFAQINSRFLNVVDHGNSLISPTK